MQSYNVYALGQLYEEREDESAQAHRRPKRVSRRRNDAQRRSLRRLMARMREANRSLAARA